jgi:hypothetical protein
MNLEWMALAALLVGILGYIAGLRFQNRAPAGCAVILVLILIMARGYYWNIFGRGEGFFTANRISAVLLLVIIYSWANYIGTGKMMHEMRARDDE